MAHERITGDDVAGSVIVHWTDDGCIVDIGMMWDDPKGCTVDGVEQGDKIVERRVEGSAGGEITVPVAAYDAANPDGPSEPPPLRAWLDNEGRWSIYMAFDRPKLNGLIRTLRRARNKAFGADE